ncbi:MAG TPA: S1C family serine protease [Pyrinomonadaceae bacterium]|nr:S1C family serine protease [Pyrinomonadaceae bacterium]
MKNLILFALTATLFFSTPSYYPAIFAQEIKQEKLTNKDLIEMTKSGLPETIILAKMKTSGVNFDTSPAALLELKKEGVSDAVILAILQPGETKPARIKDELTSNFNRLKSSVVTVWSEFGHGTGFIIDKEGLILTNQHVVGPSQYIAAQFDEKRKVPAVLLASSPEKDVAVLWVNLETLPDATVAPIARSDAAEPAITEGERVFTIGSPLNQKKIITTGIASKIEEKAILSDININHGNSGGALFNSIGEVVGITTFGDPDSSGPGVSGIVRIEQALPIIDEARKKMEGSAKPSGKLLAVDPTDIFPIEAIKEVAVAKKFDTSRYITDIGDFTVTFMTPTLKYRMETEAEREAAKTREKRNNKEGAVQGTFRPFENIRGWREYTGDYKPILQIRATPELAESFWGAVGRGMAANYGIRLPARLRFKTDFYRMRLLCGEKEVEPIHPAKIAHLLNENNYLVSINDAAYEGFYSYPADAINPSCGKVTLEIFSEKKPNEAKTKVLDQKTVARIATDFIPYLEKR